MTPKEKAKELMQKAYDLDQYNKTTQSRCKQIALLCTREVITELNKLPSKDMSDLQFWGEVDYELSLF